MFRSQIRLGALLVALALALVTAAACESAAGRETSEKGEENSPTLSYVGEFSLTPTKGPIGTSVQAVGAGFEPGSRLEIAWQDLTGSWKVIDGPENFKGREYKEEWKTLTTVQVDESGAFQAELTIPEDFGFLHDVAVLQDGEVVNKAAFDVEMEMSISPTSGPPGTPITIEARGTGWRALHNSYQLTYDNKFTGWLSAVTTDGVVRAVIPATGGPGKHILRVIHGSFTFPYMNMQQSPEPNRPIFTFEFTVTDGEPVLPPPGDQQAVPAVAGSRPTDADGPVAWTDPQQGPVGTEVTLYGEGLPADTELEVLWSSQFGVDPHMIGGPGGERPETSDTLGTVTTGSDGTLQWSFKAPEGAGGWHTISLADGDKVVAETAFRVRPSAAALTPTSGPAGTTMTIHLQGVDDTDTGKIFMVVYDNALVGYACSVTSGGDITIYLPAAGEPGWHFIDLYPGIYKGEDMEQVYNYRIPQLTYADDHPGEDDIPAFRFAFEVTE